MHILDDMVVDILHQVFDKMKGASQEMIVGSTFQKKTALLRSNLQRAKTENTKANKEYDSLKAELLKAVQGKSGMPMEILSEVMQGVRQRVIDTSKQVAALTLELEESKKWQNCKKSLNVLSLGQTSLIKVRWQSKR